MKKLKFSFIVLQRFQGFSKQYKLLNIHNLNVDLNTDSYE